MRFLRKFGGIFAQVRSGTLRNEMYGLVMNKHVPTPKESVYSGSIFCNLQCSMLMTMRMSNFENS